MKTLQSLKFIDGIGGYIKHNFPPLEVGVATAVLVTEGFIFRVVRQVSLETATIDDISFTTGLTISSAF